ncbi:MAG: cytochrome c [Deltaproteobacteria bacterium]|nr:cytochrome c [Deltaproteobacteria bacterium]
MTRVATGLLMSAVSMLACIRQPAPRTQPAAAPAAAAPVEAWTLKGDSGKGALIFKQFCTPCHGDGGRGDGPASAALNPKPADFTDAKRAAASTDQQIYTTAREGGPAVGKSPLMVAWKASLNEQQLQDVVAFVRSLSKPAAR